jgi:hypothetical protein
MSDLPSLLCVQCRSIAIHDVCSRFEGVSTRPPFFECATVQSGLFVTVWGEILQCRTCGTLSFRRRFGDCSGTCDWAVYPERVDPEEISGNLPETVDRILRETLRAIDTQLFMLAAAGMRGIVEAICQQYNCTGPDLQHKISKLKTLKNGPLSPAEANSLQPIRIFGNKALHNMRRPTAVEIALAMRVVQHVLKTLYDLPRETATLRQLANKGGGTVP